MTSRELGVELLVTFHENQQKLAGVKETLRYASKKRCILLILVGLLAGAIIATFRTVRVERGRHALQRNRFKTVASFIANNIEVELRDTLSTMRQIAALLNLGPEASNLMCRHFKDFARILVNASLVISNLELAPAGVIDYIYPIDGQEMVLGENSFTFKGVRKATIAAAELGASPTVHGPLKLGMGCISESNFSKLKHIGIVIQLPIFTSYAPKDVPNTDPPLSFRGVDTPEGQSTYLWGFAIIIVNLNSILKVMQVRSFVPDMSFQFRTIQPHHQTLAHDVFLHSDDLPPSQNMTDPVVVHVSTPGPSRDWELGCQPAQGWMKFSSEALFQIVLIWTGAILSFVLMFAKESRSAALGGAMQKFEQDMMEQMDEEGIEMVEARRTTSARSLSSFTSSPSLTRAA